MAAEPRPPAGQAVLDETHDPARTCWVGSANAEGADFPIQNLPLGVFSPGEGSPARVGVAVGDAVLDLSALADGDMPAAIRREHVAAPTLEPLLALGRPTLAELRRRLSDLLSSGEGGNRLRRRRDEVLLPASRCALHRPTGIPDFTDFYAGIDHARRAGAIARPGSSLAPNYASQPVAYHGRASTVRVSGSPVRRPWGPRPGVDGGPPVLGPTAALDFELELGFFVCGTGDAGRSVAAASGRVAGMCLLNDWSARDIQRWEMAPLGPFLGKSFATTVSPWLVTMEALAPFRVPARQREPDHPPLLPYLDDQDDQAGGGLDIALAAAVATPAMRAAQEAAKEAAKEADGAEVVARSNARYLYWTVAQMLAHHGVNGCELRPGDLLGTGTISGPGTEQSGSLLELTSNGRDPVGLRSGEARGYLQDGDEVVLSARCRRDGFVPIGFGPCAGTVVPADGAGERGR